MARKITKKTFVTFGLICFLFVMIPLGAFSWNQATHAYIADRLGACAGHDDLSEMWGSVMPDFINYIFDPALCTGWIWDQTNGTYSETCMKVRAAAETKSEYPLAYGFSSHNQQWGADYTAHISCLTYVHEDGYIIVKAKQLLDTPLNPANLQQTFGDAFASLGADPDERIDRTVPIRFSFDETFDVGEDTGTPVSEDYDVPFKFTGNSEKVVINLGETELGASNHENLRKM